eukprot:6408158-Amphidinium_carterae.4
MLELKLDLTEKQLKPTIYTESSSVKCLATQLGATKRTKHQLHQEGALRLHKVGADDNSADLMTKYLETANVKHAHLMGLHDKIRSINMVTNHDPRPRGYTATSATLTTSRPRPVHAGFPTQAARVREHIFPIHIASCYQHAVYKMKMLEYLINMKHYSKS